MRLARALVVVLVMIQASARAAPKEDLAKARDAIRSANFAAAIPVLAKLLYPKPRLTTQAELAEAHLLLGVSYFETEEPAAARNEFDEALLLDSGLTLPKLLFSKSVVRFFDRRKAERLDFIERTLENKRNDELEAKLRAAEANKETVIVQSFLPNLITFGAGQFQNGHDGKGYFFAVTESAFAVTSIATAIYLAAKYDWPADGSVPLGEARSARNLQALQATTGGIAIGLALWSLFDGWYHYERAIRFKGTVPKEFRDKSRKRSSESTSFRLIPVLGRKSKGIGASWEF